MSEKTFFFKSNLFIYKRGPKIQAIKLEINFSFKLFSESCVLYEGKKDKKILKDLMIFRLKETQKQNKREKESVRLE